MPCESVIETRIEADAVLAAYIVSNELGRMAYSNSLQSYDGSPAAANGHVLSLRGTSVRMMACRIDDERVQEFKAGNVSGEAPTKWATLPFAERPYYTQATLQRVSPIMHIKNVASQNDQRLIKMDTGKFIVSDGHMLVQKVTELAVTALTSEMTPRNMARSLTAVSRVGWPSALD